MINLFYRMSGNCSGLHNLSYFPVKLIKIIMLNKLYCFYIVGLQTKITIFLFERYFNDDQNLEN